MVKKEIWAQRSGKKCMNKAPTASVGLEQCEQWQWLPTAQTQDSWPHGSNWDSCLAYHNATVREILLQPKSDPVSHAQYPTGSLPPPTTTTLISSPPHLSPLSTQAPVATPCHLCSKSPLQWDPSWLPYSKVPSPKTPSFLPCFLVLHCRSPANTLHVLTTCLLPIFRLQNISYTCADILGSCSLLHQQYLHAGAAQSQVLYQVHKGRCSWRHGQDFSKVKETLM